MLGLLKKLFGGKPAEATAEAPYKVDAPVLTEVVEAPKAEAAPAPVVETKKPAPKKKAAPKQTAPKQPKQGGAKKGGRKPKSKPQV